MEESVVDRKNKTLTSYARNISSTSTLVRSLFVFHLYFSPCPTVRSIFRTIFLGHMRCILQVVEEKCTFARDDETGTGVSLLREVFVTSPIKFIGSTLQSIGMSR